MRMLLSKLIFLHISSRNNFAGKPIFSTKIPIDIEFVAAYDDGVGECEITVVGLRLAGKEDYLDGKATITTETDLEIHYDFKNTTQHGIYFKLYSVVDDAIKEELLQSKNIIAPKRTGGYVEFRIDEPQEIDDLILVMYNTAGEVLHQMLLELSLSVEAYDRPRKRAERPEEKPKKGGFLSGLGKMFGLD